MLTCSGVACYPYDCNPDNVWGALDTQRMAVFYFGDPFCLGTIPGYVKRIWNENPELTPTMNDDELQLIKDYTVDYFSFSYYRSSTYAEDAKMYGDTGGIQGKGNPFLKESSPKPWSWAVDPKGSALCAQRALRPLPAADVHRRKRHWPRRGTG